MIINKPDEMNIAEAKAYAEYVEANFRRKLKRIEIKVDGEYVDLNYEFEPMRFERIRRITGYLVGSLDTWNNGKRAEEADRVKHDMEVEQL